MFSGITQGLFEVIEVNKQPNLLHYTVKLSEALSKNLKVGKSVSINGVCQTVIHAEGNLASFQAIGETLDKTTLNELEKGHLVSVERSLRYGDEIGGHEVSGHVFGTGIIHEIHFADEQLHLVIQCQLEWMKYILPKGFISVDGSSLTIGETDPARGLFHLYLIPETVRMTNFIHKKPGNRVNLELDYKTKAIIDTLERHTHLIA